MNAFFMHLENEKITETYWNLIRQNEFSPCWYVKLLASKLDMSIYSSYFFTWDITNFVFRKTSCPICYKSLIDMTMIWESYDSGILNTEMPEIYRNYYVNVSILFHTTKKHSIQKQSGPMSIYHTCSWRHKIWQLRTQYIIV